MWMFVWIALIGVLVQAGGLVLATGIAADRQVSFPRALGIVVMVHVVHQGLAGMLEVAEWTGLAGPMNLLIWTVVLAGVGNLRLGQSLWTALLMGVLQFVLFVVVAVTLAGVLIGG